MNVLYIIAFIVWTITVYSSGYDRGYNRAMDFICGHLADLNKAISEVLEKKGK